MPRDATSLAELERIVMRMAAKENRWKVYARAAAQAGVVIEPDELWMLARIAQNKDRHTEAGLARRFGSREDQCQDLMAKLRERSMATTEADGAIALTEDGWDVYRRLIARREADLEHMLRDWNPKEHAEVRAKLASLAESFASSPPVRP